MGVALVAVSGPLRGQRVVLGDDEVTLGRHPSNTVAIPDIGVSRRHCVVRPSASTLAVHDLESRHGTFVNDQPVGQRTLSLGDVLSLGASTFLLVDDMATPAPEDSSADSAGFELNGDCTVPETAIHLPPSASRYLSGVKDDDPLDSDRALAALLALARAAADRREIDTLAPVLVRHLLTAVPASRAAVLAVADGGASLVTVCARDPGGRDTQMPISQTIARRVVADGTAILCNDLETQGWAEAASIVAASTHAVLCVPMTRGEQVLGALYLDRVASNPMAPAEGFSDDHLQWTAAAGALAAASLATVLELGRLRDENTRLREGEAADHGMVGESPSMAAVADFIARAAPTESTVLVLGESGTGKELVARALHRASDRATGPFIAINCATLSDTLLESELFGHEKGAFTGAVARKVGKLERAAGGTLFLDEVGELPLILQAKLLRVLEERVFERVGGTRPVRTDLRLVAATNRDLGQAVGEGLVRADLYYRLNVVSVTLPALRDRRSDIALLARHFVRLHAQRVQRRVDGLTADALGRLARYDWPGNVRELSNAIERAVVLGRDEMIRPSDLPETILESDPGADPSLLVGPVGETPSASYHDALNREKRRLIIGAVDTADGNITRAAERLGLHANHLHRLISNLGLRDALRER